MSAWKAGKVQWVSEDFLEGMVVDLEDGEFYYLEASAVEKLNSLIKADKKLVKIKFKISQSLRATKAIDVDKF